MNIAIRHVFKTKIDTDENGAETRTAEGPHRIEITLDECDMKVLGEHLASLGALAQEKPGA